MERGYEAVSLKVLLLFHSLHSSKAVNSILRRSSRKTMRAVLSVVSSGMTKTTDNVNTLEPRENSD